MQTRPIPGRREPEPSTTLHVDAIAALLGLRARDELDEQIGEAGLGDDEAHVLEMSARWHDAVTHAAGVLLDRHGLGLHAVTERRALRPFERPATYRLVPVSSWRAAADAIRITVNGAGEFSFATLADFLASGPYTARRAVLAHLGYVRRWPALFGAASAHALYEGA